MQVFKKEMLEELRSDHKKPCISLYLPTHETSPDNLQDPIRLKNLVKEAEKQLKADYSAREIEDLLEPIQELGKQDDFWNHMGKGLAVFRAPDYFKTVNLQMETNEEAVVADSFYVKPLRKYLQTKDRFQVLALSIEEVKLFEGNRHSLTEVNLHPSVDDNLEDAVGKQTTERHLTVASYGGVRNNGSVAMRHGHGGKKDEVDKDIMNFFQSVSDDIDQYHSRPSGLPLMLAALPEHQHYYKEINDNPLLMDKTIDIDPFGVSTDKLSDMAWEVMEPEYNAYLQGLVDELIQAVADNRGSYNLEEVGKAVALGQIDRLLVADDTKIQGKIDENGAIKETDLKDPETKDLTDVVADMVTEKGGEVIVLPRKKMPNKAGLGAIYRYAL